MIEIRKEIVNGVGSVQRTEHVAFVDCSITSAVMNVIQHYN